MESRQFTEALNNLLRNGSVSYRGFTIKHVETVRKWTKFYSVFKGSKLIESKLSAYSAIQVAEDLHNNKPSGKRLRKPSTRTSEEQ